MNDTPIDGSKLPLVTGTGNVRLPAPGASTPAPAQPAAPAGEPETERR